MDEPIEPFSDASQRLAETRIGAAIDDLTDVGLSVREIAHSLICAGLGFMPAGCCAECLEGEYRAVITVVEDRIDEIPNPVPGTDVAVSGEHIH
jgi:hypothetical protein